jgi:hypothetical protein
LLVTNAFVVFAEIGGAASEGGGFNLRGAIVISHRVSTKANGTSKIASRNALFREVWLVAHRRK